MKHHLIALALLLAGSAHAADTAPYACLPKVAGGTGTAVTGGINAQCAWVGWYCPGFSAWPQIAVIDVRALTSTHQVLIQAALNRDLDLAAVNDMRSRLATANIWSGPLYECWIKDKAKLLAVRPASADIHISELEGTK